MIHEFLVGLPDTSPGAPGGFRVEVITDSRINRNPHADVKASITRAITRWAGTSTLGKEAYFYTSGKLHVGDLICYLDDPDLIRAFNDEGIAGIEITKINSQTWHYYEPLISDSKPL